MTYNGLTVLDNMMVALTINADRKPSFWRPARDPAETDRAVELLARFRLHEQRDRLIRKPELIGPAVEELLRFTAPVEIGSENYAREDLTLHGVTLKRGERVLPVLASANRDETQFDAPDRLDIARDPNRHVALGSGIHFCLGAQLARMEGRIAIGKLFERFPGLELAVPAERLRWKKQIGLRGLEALPVRW